MIEDISDKNKHEWWIDLSMHCKLSVLSSFHFLGIDACNDIFAIFRFDPSLNLHLESLSSCTIV